MVCRIFFLSVLVLINFGCSDSNNTTNCPAVEVENGVYKLKIDNEIVGKFPVYSIFGTEQNLERGCKRVRSLAITYLWTPDGLEPFSYKERADDYSVVRVYLRGAGYYTQQKTEPEVRKLIRLNHYPLKIPQDLVAKQNGEVYVDGSRYSDPFTGREFRTFCNFDYKKTGGFNTNVQFSKYPGAKCRGIIAVTKGDKWISFLVDVWAYRGTNEYGIKNINKIYDALVEEFLTIL
jgi:hypothetical protein